MLLVDSLANNTDFGWGVGDNAHVNLMLYDGTGDKAKVRVGGSVNTTAIIAPSPGGSALAGTMPFSYIIDSTENLFNDIPAIVPSTIRDVAWYLNLGKGTDKVVFDEWLNPSMLVWSEWLPAIVHTNTSVPAAQRPLEWVHYRDDFLGGTWQSNLGARQNNSQSRRLLTFPDSSFINVTGRESANLHAASGALLKSFDFGSYGGDSRQWLHFSFQSNPAGNSVTFFLNGYKKRFLVQSKCNTCDAYAGRQVDCRRTH